MWGKYPNSFFISALLNVLCTVQYSESHFAIIRRQSEDVLYTIEDEDFMIYYNDGFKGLNKTFIKAQDLDACRGITSTPELQYEDLREKRHSGAASEERSSEITWILVSPISKCKLEVVREEAAKKGYGALLLYPTSQFLSKIKKSDVPGIPTFLISKGVAKDLQEKYTYPEWYKILVSEPENDWSIVVDALSAFSFEFYLLSYSFVMAMIIAVKAYYIYKPDVNTTSRNSGNSGDATNSLINESQQMENDNSSNTEGDEEGVENENDGPSWNDTDINSLPEEDHRVEEQQQFLDDSNNQLSLHLRPRLKLFIKLSTISWLSEEEVEGDTNTCAVCIEKFKSNEELIYLPCKHYFHIGCMKNLLKSGDGRCPLCRYVYVTSDIICTHPGDGEYGSMYLDFTLDAFSDDQAP